MSAGPVQGLTVFQVRPGAPERPDLVAVLRRAFDQDAHINWLLRQDSLRGAAMSNLFSLLLRDLAGELHATADLKAAALWFAPGRAKGWREQLSFFQGYIGLAGPVRAISRGLDLKLMERRRPRRAHYYLQLLGVDPARQRQGHGRALLGHLLRQASASGHPVYLETSSWRNVAFYASHGFGLGCESRCSGGLRLWSMLWEPGPGTESATQAASRLPSEADAPALARHQAVAPPAPGANWFRGTYGERPRRGFAIGGPSDA